MLATYNTKLTDFDLRTFERVAQEARDASRDISFYDRVGGCARVYVKVGFETMRQNSKYAKALARAGFRVTRKPGETGVVIYVGYDNATGLQWAQGQAIADAFNVNGIPAYKDAQED